MKPFKFLNKCWKIILCAFCAFLFLFLFFFLLKNILSTLDTVFYHFVTLYRNDSITEFYLFLSYLCSTYFLVMILVFLFLFCKNKKLITYIAFNVLLCYGLNTIFKDIIKRARPTRINMVVESGYSFPSGHAMMSLAFYGFFIYLIYKSKWKKVYKFISILLLSLLITLIGISRIYLGVHYASDILAGFSLSTIYLLLYISFYQRKNIKN